MSERKGLGHLDWIALALFGVGIFGAVLLVAAWKSHEPLASLGGTARIAAMWAAVFGIVPGFVWHASLVVLGTRLFLSGDSGRLARNLLGWTGLSIALAILLGAFGDHLGGAIGAHTGAVLRDTVHVAVAVFVGAVALFAVAWFAWLRDANELAPILAQASPAPTRAPRPATAVTAAETAALLPSREELAHVARGSEPADLGDVRKLVPPTATGVAPHPYPEDVRLKGQVPVGAKPLSTGSGVAAAPVAGLAAALEVAPSVQRWSPARPLAKTETETTPTRSAPNDLAPTWESEADEVESLLAQDAEVAASAPEALRVPVVSAASSVLELSDDEDEDLEGVVGHAPEVDEGEVDDAIADEADAFDLDQDLEDVEEVDELMGAGNRDAVGGLEVEPVDRAESSPEDARGLSSVPAPTWEQADLFAGDNEPVDAYGTPLTLVASLLGNEAGLPATLPATLPAGVPPAAEHDEVSARRAALREEMRSAQTARTQVPRALEDEGVETDADLVHAEPALHASTVVEVAASALPNANETASIAVEEPEMLAEAVSIVRAARTPSTQPALVADELGFERVELTRSHGLEREVVPDFEDARAEPEFMTQDELDLEDESVTDLEELEESETGQRVAIAELVATETEPLQVAESSSAAARVDLTPSLFDEAVAAPIAAPTKKRASSKPKASVEAASEPDHVLAPHAVAPERTIKTLVLDDGRRKLLSEAGCLFVERGRVAVSMLQRQYAIDFDDACRVLDELQDLGLIGPYLGGQRRDILLTREQWLEKVSSP